MKKVTKLVVGILLLATVTACENFLIEEDKSSITQENYFTTPKQAEAAVNGIYPMLKTINTTSGNNYGEAVFVSLEMPVGHATTLGQSLYNNGLINHNNSPIEPVFEVMWSGFYKGVANANVAIKGIQSIEMNESHKNSLLGQAYFLRAFYYYHLVRLYGEIPLITDPVDFSSAELYPTVAPVEVVYDLIVRDLKQAENSGLPNLDRGGKVSLGAVKSLLASVYLTMAGNPLNKGDEYYNLAANKAKEVIDSNWYTLFESYDYLHNREHENQGEFIFQIQYKSGISTNNITQFVTPDKIGISALSGEVGALMPRDEFIQSYEANDKRVQEQEFYFSEYPAAGSGQIIEFGEYALYKFWLVEAAGPNGDRNSDLNWTLLRLPEIMLIYAEATNELSGPTQSAYDQVNLIRERAELEPLQNLSKEDFREAIWRERYHELAFENKAYFDIQRTHQAYNLSSGSFEDVFNYTNESGVTFTDQYMLWPIPQSEIYANSNLSQNPGW